MTQPAFKESEPTTAEPSSSFTAFVLGQMRHAKLRAQIIVNQTEMAITALNAGMITAEEAILILTETGLSLNEPSS